MGRIGRAIRAFIDSGAYDDQAAEDDGYYEEEEANVVDTQKANRLQMALLKQRAKSVGLPSDLDTSALVAMALCLETLADRKYSFREEHLIITWCQTMDTVLAQTITAGQHIIQLDPDNFDPRLERYYMNYLGSDPVQFIRLEAYAVLLWIECNRDLCAQQDWILGKVAEILNYITNLTAYSNAQHAPGAPGGTWDPSYNPAGQYGMTRGNYKAPQRGQNNSTAGVYANQQNVGPPPPPQQPQQQQPNQLGPQGGNVGYPRENLGSTEMA